MGIISLFGSRLTAQAGSPRSRLCLGDNDNLQQVGISICHMEERAVGNFRSVL